jgi:amidase
MTISVTAPMFRSATEASEMLRRREISSQELTRALLERIDAVNPAINAVVELLPEAAMAQAKTADDAIASGEPLPPLHGIPMTIKDSFAASGLHTTWGNPAFRDSIADTDATVVSRLRQAGAIIIGKTNVHHMLADFGQTANDVYGVTNNPWDLTRTPGGSTGGGAAALAAGMTFLEYGSDLAGSIRIPAGFCGVYGLRPTAEIVPTTGFQPPGPPAEPSRMRHIAAVGPLGRSAADLRTALAVTAGPEIPESKAYSWALPPPRHSTLSDYRIGVVLDHPRAPVSGDVGAVLADAVDALARSGATIVEGWPDGVDPASDYGSFGFQVGLFLALQEAEPEFATLPEIVHQEARRNAVRAAWARYFGNVDVFLCPVTFTSAFPHDDRPFEERMITTSRGDQPYPDLPFWIAHASLAGLPAVAAPIGRTDTGLPVGVQVVAPLFEDDTAITFAELLDEVIGGYEIPEQAR